MITLQIKTGFVLSCSVSEEVDMTKTEKYFKAIQQIAIENCTLSEYLDKLDIFLTTQTLLKRNKIKIISEKVIIFYIEYVNNRLEGDFKAQEEVSDIVEYLYNKISKDCIELKTVCTDEVVIKILQNKKDKINSIVVGDYVYKKNKVKELENEIRELKEGWI